MTTGSGGYSNFDLVIEKNNGGYRALAKGTYGEAQCAFTSPFSAADFEALADRLDRSRAARRRIETPQLTLAKEVGGRLHAAVLASDVRAVLRGCVDDASNNQMSGVRIRLDLSDVPELAVLPWEFLFDPDQKVGRFLALADETPLVRYLPLPEKSKPLMITPPLRLLVVVSNPADDRYPELDVEKEWSLLQEALAQPIGEGLLTLERLKRATMAELDDTLQAVDANILHFIGHGRFDEQHQDGVLAFEGERGGAQEVSAEHLGTLLYNEKSLRLVVINACEGGRASATDAYAGMAQTLVRMRIPAVVAMQYEITDRAAILFARQFYRGLAMGRPVDTAITDARLAVFSQVSDLEWATPVLYMRAADGRIFDIAGHPAPAASPPPLAKPDLVAPVPAPLVTPVAASTPAPEPVVRSAPPIAATPTVPDRGTIKETAPTTTAGSAAGALAGFAPRAIACVIDLLVVVVGWYLVMRWLIGDVWDTPEYVPDATPLFLLFAGYFILFWSKVGNGRTIGMRMLGIRVVRSDGSALDLGRAVLRVIGFSVGLTAVIGVLWAAFDGKRRAWHDMFADTKVIRVD